MFTTRLVKTAMVASTALFALLVTLNNLVDYNSNYQFVRHTLSMDTTFPGNALMGRANTTPVLWTAGYWAIILTEAAVGLMLAFAALQLAVNLRSGAASFNAAKKYAIAGAGQEPAFRFYMSLLAVVIFLSQPDGELDA